MLDCLAMLPSIGHMYLRESKQRRADGSVVTYLQLAENVWNPEKRRSETRIVYNCGRADDPAVVERLRQLATSILRRCSPEEIVAAGGDWRLVCAWPYGEVYVLQALWQRLGIGAGPRRAGAVPRRLGFDVERALFAMVANRACAPCSKLYCCEQWLQGGGPHRRAPQGLSLQHLYRAMDFLEANKEPIEREIFYRVADLLNLDVEVLFYDTTSCTSRSTRTMRASGPRTSCMAAQRPGARPTARRASAGMSKNGRGDAPQIVVGHGGHARGLPGAALGVPRQHGGRHHGGAGQARLARLATHALPVRGRRGHGLGGQLQGAGRRRRQVPHVHADAPR